MNQSVDNPYREVCELQNLNGELSPPNREIAMTPARAETYLLLAEFALDAMESDLPEAWRTRAARILKMA